MRGETAEPLDAFERTVGAMREQPRAAGEDTDRDGERFPTSDSGRSTRGRHSAAVAEQGRTAKGDVPRRASGRRP